MLREERFELIKAHTLMGQEYAFKVLSTDTVNPEIIPWLQDNYSIITVCRRNHFDAYLSWLVAWYNQYWNQQHGEAKPKYQKFTAEKDLMVFAGTNLARYFQIADRIDARAHLYYEDMIELEPIDVLKACNAHQPGTATPPSRYQKLTDTEQKMNLIENIEEVMDYYANSIAPMVGIYS
jgi:hypothetical protein